MVRLATRVDTERPYLIPNKGPVPHLGEEEGLGKGPVPICNLEEERLSDYHWSRGLKPWDRLHHHATMSSTRRHVYCQRPFEPKDELDFILSSDFNPIQELLPEKMDIYMQPETKFGDEMNIDIMERIRDKEVYYYPSERFIRKRPDLRKPFFKLPEEPEKTTWRVFRNRMLIIPSKSLPRDHPIKYGGTLEKKSVFSVKLGISADHTSQTNPGYSRTPSGSYYSI